MVNIQYIVLCLGCMYLSFKLIEVYRKHISEKYPNNLNRFLSDLYKVQRKYLELGEMGYAQSVQNLITFHGNVDHIGGKPGDANVPLTNDGLSSKIQIDKDREALVRKIIDEELDTEFRG